MAKQNGRFIGRVGWCLKGRWGGRPEVGARCEVERKKWVDDNSIKQTKERLLIKGLDRLTRFYRSGGDGGGEIIGFSGRAGGDGGSHQTT